MSAEAVWGAPAAPRRDIYGRERHALGNPAPLACTVALAAMDAVHGGPGLDRVLRWLSPDVLEALQRQHSLARRARREGAAVDILRSRVCRVSREAAEVAVVARMADRAHAVAMRLEDVGGRWLVTVLDIG